MNHLTEFSNKMSKYRKKRVISADLITPEELESFVLLAANPVHKTTQVMLLFMLNRTSCSCQHCPQDHSGIAIILYYL